MTSKLTEQRVLALMRIAGRPMLIRDMIPVIMTNEESEEQVRNRINNILRKLCAEGKVRKVDQAFLKSGTWAWRWEAVQ